MSHLAKLLRQRIDELDREVDEQGVTEVQATAFSDRLRDDMPMRASYLARCAQELRRLLTLAGEAVTAVERRRG